MKKWWLAGIVACLLAAAVVAPVAGASRKSSKKAAKKAAPPAPATAESSARVEEYLALARQTPVENVGALVPFFEQLYRSQSAKADGGIHILHYGDSHTAADEWTGFLRSLFQNRFGDGGSGF